MGEFRSYRDAAKINWGSREEGNLSLEQINCGAMLRLVDASERIAEALERIANRLDCQTTANAARAIIRMDKRMAKRTKL